MYCIIYVLYICVYKVRQKIQPTHAISGTHRETVKHVFNKLGENLIWLQKIFHLGVSVESNFKLVNVKI